MDDEKPGVARQAARCGAARMSQLGRDVLTLLRRHPYHARTQELGIELLGDLVCRDFWLGSLRDGVASAITAAMVCHAGCPDVQWRCCETLAYLMEMAMEDDDGNLWGDIPFQREGPEDTVVFRTIIAADPAPSISLALERFPLHPELQQLAPVLLAVLRSDEVCVLARINALVEQVCLEDS